MIGIILEQRRFVEAECANLLFPQKQHGLCQFPVWRLRGVLSSQRRLDGWLARSCAKRKAGDAKRKTILPSLTKVYDSMTSITSTSVSVEERAQAWTRCEGQTKGPQGLLWMVLFCWVLSVLWDLMHRWKLRRALKTVPQAANTKRLTSGQINLLSLPELCHSFFSAKLCHVLGWTDDTEDELGDPDAVATKVQPFQEYVTEFLFQNTFDMVLVFSWILKTMTIRRLEVLVILSMQHEHQWRTLMVLSWTLRTHLTSPLAVIDPLAERGYII